MSELGPHPGPGDTVGPYRIVAPVGVGGMASVYRAEGPTGDVALKILNPARVLPEEVKRFTREYQALQRMDHPNITRVYDAGVHDGYPWIAMEFVDGSDLEGVIKKWQSQETPPDVRFAQIDQLLRGLAEGLQYVHDLGLIHRDLKPTNVLVTTDLQPKISDFGVVKDPNARGTQLTMAGRLVGTVAFMAPELISGEPVDRRADLYALGAVLYVMLTFQRPIEAKSVAGYLARHLTEIPQPPSEVDPDVPRRLERVCQRLLFKDPSHRYPNARAVLLALDKPDDDSEPPLRGRDELMSAWDERLERLEAGAGGALLVVGPDGSGRSRVLSAFAEHAEARDLRTITASVAKGNAMAQVLRSFDIDPLDPKRKKLLPQALGDTPTVILVDDLDHAGAPVVDALSELVRTRVAREGAPYLLVGTATDTGGVLAELSMGSAIDMEPEHMALGPLPARAAVTMIRDRGLTGRIAPVLGRRLHAIYCGLAGYISLQLEALIEEDWLEVKGDGLVPKREFDDFRRGELPVPKTIQADIESRLKDLDPYQAELVELLACLDRGASAGLLTRACADPDQAARALDDLVRLGLLSVDDTEGAEVVQFRNPCAPPVVRGQMSDLAKRARHGAIARALGGRRRRSTSSLEIAQHLNMAGEPLQAYPIYIQAARRAARAQRFSEVLQACNEADIVRMQCEREIEPSEAARLRRWLKLLEGEALLARGQWNAAVAPLVLAVGAARDEGDPAALARSLGSLGRAHYRQGQFEQAAPLLREALTTSDEGAPERASATRALADILLREGRLEDAEVQWLEALEIAIEVGSWDGEARARRGLAHVRGLQGRLPDASDELDRADEILSSRDGDPRVRAGVLARSIELDTAAGRYASALHRADLLVSLARNRELSERLPEAYALQTEALVLSGERERAASAAKQAVAFAQANGAKAWNSRLRASRAWLDLGDVDAAKAALPDADTLPTSIVDDPVAQHAVLRARIAASTATGGHDLANWALVRPAPLLGIRAALVFLDAAKALTASGQVAPARDACKRGLKTLQGAGADGLRFELLVALDAARPDPRVVDAAGQVADRLTAGMPLDVAKTFKDRPEVAAVLSRRS